MTGAVGRIHEGGYRKYEGERLGPSAALTSVVRQTVQRVMGQRRPARAKALPYLSVLIAYLPALVFVGLVALLPRGANESFIPAYHDYYSFISAAIVLFVVFVAPEALCPDRRSRVLSLYLAAPLTRTTYLLAKAVAVASVLLLVTLGPPLVLLIGRVAQGDGPDGPLAFLTVFARVTGAGLVLSLFYTGISIGISSLTDRRAFASGGTLLAILGSTTIAATFVATFELSESFLLLNLNVPANLLVQRVYGAPGVLTSISTPLAVLAAVVWPAAGFALAWWRYKVLRVTR